MISPTISKPRRTVKSLLYLLVLLSIAFNTATIHADGTDGHTPLALQPGAPAGSYALSDLDNINPYNGSLNFRLPLLGFAGRGTAGYTMTLPIEQKWRINVTPIYFYVYQDGGAGPLPDPQVTYYYFPIANWWSGIKPGYGPGVMQGRVGQYDAQVCPDSTMRASLTLTRLTFTAPDGTEFELRDKQTDGAPAGVGLCDQTGLNRGKTFVTADGSAATFISDQNIVDYILMPGGGNDLFYPSGYLLLRDGTRYRIDEGVVSWLRDRNGNKMTFTYDSFKRMTLAKDSLNREVTVVYSTSTVAYDEITYKGFGGGQRSIRVNYASLSDTGSLRAGYSIQTYHQLFPMQGASSTTNYNPKIVRSVTLPNNQQYQFQYNSYGELARVILPTGGAFEYDHSGGFGGGDASGIVGGGEGNLNVYRRVITRRAYDDGSTLTRKTTFSGQNLISGNTNYVLVDQLGSDGATRINQQKLHFEGFAENSFFLLPTDYSPWKDGREYQSEAIAADGSTVLQRSARTWQQPVPGATWPLTQPENNAAAKSNNPQITQILTTLEPGQANKVSKQTFAYDKYANRTDAYEYDFGTGTAGPLVRRTHTDYLTASYDTLNPSASNPDLSLTSHIRSLPTQVSVFDAAGVERARAATEYDNYVLDGSDCQHSFHCPLTARSNISGLDSAFTTSYTKRGNPTAVTSFLLVNGSVTSSVSAYSQYDVAGNVVRTLDPRSTLANNIATMIEYDDRFGAPDNEARANSAPGQLAGLTSFAFPTKVTNALGQSAYAQFDYYVGKAVNGEDTNGVVAAGYFNDALDRTTQVRRAIGTSAENQTTFAYNDANRIVTTSSDRDTNNDGVLVTKMVYDQMGRTIETRMYEGGTNYTATQTQYDALGRAFKTSNPFRPWQSETAVWTTQSFDALGRVISVTTPDNAVITTIYSGNVVTVSDQTGKQRKSVTDALGRLVQVYEAPNDANYNYLTAYAYDTLDNLITVTQGSQTRTFVYDSLKRLTAATNPESGTITYQYDNSGNLLVRTDARTDPQDANKKVSTHYEYDGLNRLTRRWYNGSSATSATTHNNPTLPSGVGASNEGKFFYDAQTLPSGAPSFSRGASTGRLVAQTYGTGSNGDYFAYDGLGRQTLKIQQTGTINYQMSAAYNLSGAVTSMTYPSGRTISNSFDAAGRLTTFSGNLGDGTTRSYANEILYSSLGSMAKEKFGTTTPIYNKLFYNVRGQLAEIRVSTSYTGPTDTNWNRGAIINHYSDQCWGMCSGSSMTDNNGNLKKQDVYIPHDDQISNYTQRWQQYDYDPLNRLKWVREIVSGAEQWKQQFIYDRWGNRTIDTGVTYGTGINNKAFTVNTANNRLGVPGGQSGVMTYDNAGNLTNDTYTGAGNRTYDAENKITSAWGGNNQAQLYAYDASGQRIKRTVDGVETWQVYGFGGELLAEYPASGAATTPQKEYGYRNGQLLVTAESSSSGNPAASGLAGYWRFDENSGTTSADSSGNGHTGSLTSGAGWTTGQSGAAVNLDGVDDYVQMGSQSSLVMTSAASFSAWIYPTGQGSNATFGGTILVKEGEYVIARYPNGTIQWGFANSNPGWTFFDTGYVAPLNQWTHLAVTYDSGTVKTYANGSLVHTYNGTGAIGDANTGQNDFRIGGRQVISQHFQGRIDDVRIYNRALNASEVVALMGSLTSLMKAHWKLDENSGTSSADSSGNGHTGSLTSGAGWTTGQSGSAVNLDGVDDYVQVGSQSSLVMTSAASFSAWIYPTGAGSNATHGGTILVKEGEYVIARYPNGTIQWGFANSNPGWTFYNTGYVAPLHQWTHLAVTYDSGTIKTYANGALVHTYNGSGSIGDAITGQNDFRIGGRQVISQHFQGRIDDVRVYSRSLTAGEVSSLANGSSSGHGSLNWLIADHLGTPRMIIDQTGSLANVKRHDYLPFGEELFAPTGGRSMAHGYSGGDGLRQQFTLKERDVETGLDYFLARYYSSVQGRFTSADPMMASGRASSPQSWNRYSYVRNNPLRLVDPSGLQDEDAQTFTVTNPCEWGTAGCYPIKVGVVTVTSPQEQPIPLETTDLSVIENVTLVTGQVVSDTVVGAGKFAYNALYGAANLVNAPIDYGLSFFTDFQFGSAELYQASTPGERNAMYTMTACSIALGAYGAFSGAGAQTTALANTATASNEVRAGTQVFRVFGDDASAFGNPAGGSFTTINPGTVSNYRAAAGLPSQNTGRFVLEGTLSNTRGVTFRHALPGAGGRGGLPELVIPNAAQNVTVTRVSGVNPPF